MIVDKFGNQIKEGDYFLGKFTNYGRSSELAVGKITKLNRTRHQVIKCDNNGAPIINGWGNRDHRIFLMDQYNMVRIEEPGGTPIKVIKKMTL